jgi:hypothetical protein
VGCPSPRPGPLHPQRERVAKTRGEGEAPSGGTGGVSRVIIRLDRMIQKSGLPDQVGQ